MKNRLLEFIKSKDISNRRFLLKCGLSETYINTLTGNPIGDTIAKIEEAYPDLNIQWLKTGEGEMLKVPAVLTVYNPTAEDAKAVEAGMELSMYPAEVVEGARAEVIEEAQAPIIPRQIANTGGTNIKKYIGENASELEYFNPLSITGDGLVVGIVRTAEMSPTLMPHDRVFINFLKDKMHITDGDVYFWVTKSHPAMFRIAKKESNDYFRLIAENPRYGDIIIHSSEIINIGTTDGGLFRQKIVCQTEIEEVRRKKDEQIDKLIAQNGEALQIIGAMIRKTNNQ